MSARNSWNVQSSETAKRTRNPIREIVESMKVSPNKEKPMIALSIGDPTVFGNLKPPQCAVDSMCATVQAGKFNGYLSSLGAEGARDAVARKFTHPDAAVTSKDVILASGCSGALEIAIVALASFGQNILVPLPGFPLYTTIAESRGIETKSYRLLPERNWEVDLAHMESLIDSKTTAILINNPSNPCGSNFTEQHLKDILALAEKHYLPIISDEIYADMVFPPNVFTPLAPLSKNVPVLTCGGIAKQYLVPGWRLGWIICHDRNNVFATEIREALTILTQILVGPNALVQGALPALLHETDPQYYRDLNDTLQAHAQLSYDRVSKIKGLKPVLPQGTMYMMVEIDMAQFPEYTDDLEFTEALISEQSVFCLPAKCFSYPNYFRIVFTAPKDKLETAYDRIEEFCNKHRKN